MRNVTPGQELTLRLSGASHTAQMVCYKIDQGSVILNSMDGKWTLVAPAKELVGIVVGDMIAVHMGWIKGEIVPVDPAPSIIKPGLVL